MEIPITNCFQFSFKTNENLYQMILLRTLDIGANKSLIKMQIKSDIKIVERTKVYYCSNSKGDHFAVKQLQHTRGYQKVRALMP